MCQAEPAPLRPLSSAPVVITLQPRPQGSRRRRLWELGSHAHCPVVGVCLPIAALRRMVAKRLGGQPVADDYGLHCGVIAECKVRTPLAEAVHKELDQRYAQALRDAARAKTTEALAAWWDEAVRSHDIAGPFWATLTHARCTEALEQAVLGEVHMLQHQAGMAARVSLERFEALIEENAVLARELGAAQQRCTQLAAQQARRIEEQQADIVRLRAELVGRDTRIAQLQERMRELEAAAPTLRSRFELGQENHRLMEQAHELQRALLQARQEAERQQRRADEAAAELQQAQAASPHAPPTHDPAPELTHRAVLCVGGRPASVPAYRQIVERTGGRFLHHDGGEEDGIAKLESTLAAADLVICQTGCISHDAYWRVKNHCKRTGKRCLFVETPSRAGLERALSQVRLSCRPAECGE